MFTLDKGGGTMLKAIKNIPYLLGGTITLWSALSYIEIAIKCINNPVYSNFNLLVWIFKNFNI